MTFKYTIEAKPTTYNGVNFRSRLEARWAAFFDICDLKWIYEPVDFGAWSPDFLVRDCNSLNYYSEVKPIIDFDISIGKKIIESPACHVWLLGLNPEHWWVGDCGYWESAWFGKYPISLSNKWNEAGNLVQFQVAA